MKLNRLRNLALGLIFGAFLVMYIGVFFKVVLPLTLVIGTIMILISVFIYLRVGSMSLRLLTVDCPNCHRKTKVMGTEDGCMHCRTEFTVESDEDGRAIAVPTAAATTETTNA